jgi:hypothetical protein
MKKLNIMLEDELLPPRSDPVPRGLKTVFHISTMLATPILALLVGSPDRCYAATASASSAGPLASTDNGSSWFYFESSAKAASMNWTDGRNTADVTTSAGPTSSSESKFTAAQLKIAGPNTFKGFASTISGIFDSTATADGSGSSSSNPGRLFGGYSAKWTVNAAGTLGKDPLGVGTPSYSSNAKGTDPWPIMQADLSGISGSQYKLWIPFEITGGSSLGSGPNFNSSFGFDVNYKTASGTVQLLQIAISGGQVSVTGDTAANFSLYSINDITASPDFTTPLTLGQLQGNLATDLSGNALVSVVDLGLSLTDIPIPTVDLGDGSVASISGDAWASDAAVGAVPETSTTWLLLLSGLGGLLGYGRWERRRAVD